MKVTVVIPARYTSTRFPGKPLVDIKGKPMIQHVYERVLETKFVDEVFVATDDNRIKEAVENFDGKVIMTQSTHKSGTDRVAEVAKNLSSDIFINVQGDEPFMSPKLIDQVASSLISDKHVQLASACTAFKSVDEYTSPENVKVICDVNGFAIYFSRLPIPYSKQKRNTLADIERSGVKKHIGIYGFQRQALIEFAAWKPTTLEHEEGLEQLRALDHGLKIKMVFTSETSPSIDTPDDLKKLM